MRFRDSVYFMPALLAFFLTATLCVAGLMTRPIFPVDETRYLSVAWEMLTRGNFILPTLNFEPYHHKPPVLFWMINLMWAIFGVSEKAAMVVPYITGFAVLMLTARLSTRIFPDKKDAPLIAVAVLGGTLPFVIYTNLIMFDILLTVPVLLGVTAIWDYFHTGQRRHMITLGIAIGLGALIKGPVILLHLLPLIVLYRFWAKSPSPLPPANVVTRHVGTAILLGVVIGLSWAIPAAIQGGEEFARKIFYGQSTGRMVNAFDHQRPFYWYFMLLPLFFLPWAASPLFWSGLRRRWQDVVSRPVLRFIMAWIFPVFAAFCLISGKQAHYLIPLVPAIALLVTHIFLGATENLRKRDSLPILVTAFLFSLVPVFAHYAVPLLQPFMPNSIHLEDTLGKIHITPAAIVGAIIAGLTLLFLKLRQIKVAVIATSIAMMGMMISFQFAAKDSYFQNYDLTPIGQILQENQGRPVAFLGGYNGEFSYLGRITKPITIIPERTVPTAWFNENPNGLAIVFTRETAPFEELHIIHNQPYRMTRHYLVMGKKSLAQE